LVDITRADLLDAVEQIGEVDAGPIDLVVVEPCARWI
jgi:hypothetical protein